MIIRNMAPLVATSGAHARLNLFQVRMQLIEIIEAFLQDEPENLPTSMEIHESMVCLKYIWGNIATIGEF